MTKADLDERVGFQCASLEVPEMIQMEPLPPEELWRKGVILRRNISEKGGRRMGI